MKSRMALRVGDKLLVLSRANVQFLESEPEFRERPTEGQGWFNRVP